MRVGEHLAHRARPPGRIVGRHEEGGVGGDLPEHGDVAADDGRGRRHRLHQRQAEALVVRGADQQGGAVVERAQRCVRRVAEPPQPALGGGTGQLALDRLAPPAELSAQHEGRRVGHRGAEAGPGVEQGRDVLARLDGADVQNEARRDVRGRLAGGHVVEPARLVDGMDGAGRRAATLEELGADGLRRRDDGAGAGNRPLELPLEIRAGLLPHGPGRAVQGHVVDGGDERALRSGERARRDEVGGEDDAVAVGRDQPGLDDAHEGRQPRPPHEEVVADLVAYPLDGPPLGDGRRRPRAAGADEHRGAVEPQAEAGAVGELAQQLVEVPAHAGQRVEQGRDVDGHRQAVLAAPAPDAGGEPPPPAPGGGDPARRGPRERESGAGDAVRSPRDVDQHVQARDEGVIRRHRRWLLLAPWS